jgi:hypothetical protein
MDMKNVHEQLARLTDLVDGWTEQIPAIERDLALDKLKSLYEMIKNVVPFEEREPDNIMLHSPGDIPAPFSGGALLPENEIKVEQTVQPSAFTTPHSAEPEVSVVLDDLLLASSNEFQENEAPVPFMDNVPSSDSPVEMEIPNPESNPTADSPVEEPVPEVIRNTSEASTHLFNTDELMTRPRKKRRIIMSLYDSDMPVPAVSEAPLQEPTVKPDIFEEPAVLQHLPAERITSLRSAIGLNDRYLLVRDLFDGDERSCDETIEHLDTFDNLEDCLIHIAENYDWNPACEGAKLLTYLLERKLL